MIAFYGRTLKVVLRYQTITLLVAVATLMLTLFLYIIIPKGFFPTQDTGVIQGISQAAQTIGSKSMAEKQQADNKLRYHQEVLAAKVTAPYDGKVAGGTESSAERFVSAVYQELKGGGK